MQPAQGVYRVYLNEAVFSITTSNRMVWASLSQLWICILNPHPQEIQKPDIPVEKNVSVYSKKTLQDILQTVPVTAFCCNTVNTGREKFFSYY